MAYQKKYPVTYKGKQYRKKDCDELFKIFYHDEATLEEDGSVYMLGGDYVYPDGTIREGNMLEHYGIFVIR